MTLVAGLTATLRGHYQRSHDFSSYRTALFLMHPNVIQQMAHFWHLAGAFFATNFFHHRSFEKKDKKGRKLTEQKGEERWKIHRSITIWWLVCTVQFPWKKCLSMKNRKNNFVFTLLLKGNLTKVNVMCIWCQKGLVKTILSVSYYSSRGEKWETMHFQPKKPRPVTDTGQSSPLNFMPLPFAAGALLPFPLILPLHPFFL